MKQLKKLLSFFVIISGILMQVSCSQNKKEAISSTPDHLYKILSIESWKASQGKDKLILSQDDEAFIHFSTQEQLDRIAKKYWADKSEFVVLTIDTTYLPGNMVFEANPGGENKYYHLYNGYIPLIAVIDAQTRKSK